MKPAIIKRIISVKYPIDNFIWKYVGFTVTLILVFSFELQLIVLVILGVISTIAFYFFARRRYKRINIYTDRLEISFPTALLRKSQEYKFVNVENIFFQTHGGTYEDLYFNINLKNGKTVRVRLPGQELNQVKNSVKELGLVTRTSKYVGEGLGF